MNFFKKIFLELNNKHFLLNLFGFHLFRLFIVRIIYSFRHYRSGSTEKELSKKFKNNGYVRVENFLPDEKFKEIFLRAKDTLESKDGFQRLTEGATIINFCSLKDENENTQIINEFFSNRFSRF